MILFICHCGKSTATVKKTDQYFLEVGVHGGLITKRKLWGSNNTVQYLDYGGYLTGYLSKFIDLIVTKVNFYVYKNYILINLTFNKKAILISSSLCDPATLEISNV